MTCAACKAHGEQRARQVRLLALMAREWERYAQSATDGAAQLRLLGDTELAHRAEGRAAAWQFSAAELRGLLRRMGEGDL